MKARRLLIAIARIIGGVLLIAVGALLFLPGVPGPGSVLIVAGIFVMAPNSRLTNWMRVKLHRLGKWWKKRRARRKAGAIEAGASQNDESDTTV